MDRLTRTRLCGALLLALSACQQVRVTPVAPATARPAVPTESVRLFYSRDAVPFRYEEIALLSMHVDWLVRDKEAIYLALRRKAGELGANAVIIAPMKGSPSGEQVPVLVTASGLSGNALAVFLRVADTVTTPP